MAGADQMWVLADAAAGAGRGLKGLKSSLEKSEKALDRERSKLESLTSARDSLSSVSSSSLLHDPFGNGLAGLHAQVEADSNDARAMLTALQTLVRNGLDPKGALFQALAASGDVNTAQQMAALSSQQLFAEQQAFTDRGALTGQVGQFAGTQAFGTAIAAQTKAVEEFRAEVRNLHQTIHKLEAAVERGAHKGTKAGAHEGTQAGFVQRGHRAAAEAATGSRSLRRR